MRITKKVFLDLAIYMVGFGIFIGVLFPIFTRIIGIPAEHIDVLFIIACLIAGISVGVVNIILVRTVVGKKLKELSGRMKFVSENLESKEDMDPEECYKKCVIPVDSEDVIGEASSSFNSLVKAFLTTLRSEESIRNFTEIFSNELDLEKLSEKALSHLIEYISASAGLVLIDKGGLIEVSASHLIKDPEKVTKLEIVNDCFSNKKRMMFEFEEDIVIQAGLIDFVPKAILLEPIVYKGDVLGVFLIASSKQFDPSVIEQLGVYVRGLSLGMNNAIIHDKLEQLAILDPLTKVYNRRFGVSRLQEEYKKHIRTNNPLGLLMLDIDYFKKVNDTYGHIGGDQVLKSIAELIKNNIRQEDILVRYGGEEFLAILPSAPNEGLKVAAEKIRRMIEEHEISFNDQKIRVTMSIGGASVPEHNVNDIEELIQQADDNLYHSKETGRNKVTVK